MSLLQKVNLVLVTVLTIAAGIPKIMRIPAEVNFFQDAGLGETALLVFGLFQMTGGILLIFRKTRSWGAIQVALSFLLSAVMVFMSGQIMFGLVSLVPILMTGMVLKNSLGKQARSSG